MIICIVLIIALVAATPFLLKWIIPFVECAKIGSYTEYKPVSKSLDDKKTEYSWYQIAGFKNIGTDGMDFLREISKCYTENDLKWLNEWSEFFKKGLMKAGQSNENDLFLPDPIENTSVFDSFFVAKRCKTPLPDNYQKVGCTTCGQAAVMGILLDVRIDFIKSGEEIKPDLLDDFISAVNEVKNPF